MTRVAAWLAPIAAALLCLACGTTPPSSAPGVIAAGDRSQCPGAVDELRGQLPGDDAGLIESLQAEAEVLPGFRAIVFDRNGPIVVVDRAAVAAWVIEVQGKPARVASSCVEDGLDQAVKATLKALVLEPGGSATFSYDADLDAMVVRSTLAPADMLALIEQRYPGARPAIGTGALRIDQVPPGTIIGP